jgi:hypothetical protein
MDAAATVNIPIPNNPRFIFKLRFLFAPPEVSGEGLFFG